MLTVSEEEDDIKVSVDAGVVGGGDWVVAFVDAWGSGDGGCDGATCLWWCLHFTFVATFLLS